MAITQITVRGARQHNLRDINVQIPRNALTVVTGLSGSGKSSLAFDTIYAEGQRRYVETLSAYARQFLDQIERPDVDSIEGLSPAISIEQKTTSRSPRSTVGTITEIYDYLRLLYASVGVPHCPSCGRQISRQSAEQIVERILAFAPGERVTIFAPVVRGRKGEFKDLLDKLDQQGFRARVDGEIRRPRRPAHLEKRKNHTIEAIVYRAVLKPGIEKALAASVEKALQMANGLVLVGTQHDEQLYSSSMACPDCGLDVPKLEPRSFSFNSAYGACPECHGLGSIYDFDPAKSLPTGPSPCSTAASAPAPPPSTSSASSISPPQRYKIDLKLPFEQLTQSSRSCSSTARPRPKPRAPASTASSPSSAIPSTKPAPTAYREWMMQYMSASECPVCHGRRLRPESLAVKIDGMSIADFTALPMDRALDRAARHQLHRARSPRRRTPPARNRRAPGIPQRRRPRLSLARPQRRHPLRRRRPAHPARHPDRLAPPRRALRPRRALHRPPSARQPAPHLTRSNPSATSATPSSSSSTMKKPSATPTTSSTSAPAPAASAARSSPKVRPPTSCTRPASLTGRYLAGEISTLHRLVPRPLTGKWITVEGARSHNLQNLTVHFPARRHDRRHRRLRLRQKHARQRHPLPRARPRTLRLPRSARRVHRRSTASTTSTRPSASTSPPSAAPRAPIPPPTPASSPPSATSSPCSRESRERGYKAGPLLLQRPGRPLRSLPGRRPAPHRNELPPRRLRPLRSLQRPPLQSGNPRGQIQRLLHRRRPRPRHRRRAPRPRRHSPGRARSSRPWSTSASATSTSASPPPPSPAAKPSA